MSTEASELTASTPGGSAPPQHAGGRAGPDQRGARPATPRQAARPGVPTPGWPAAGARPPADPSRPRGGSGPGRWRVRTAFSLPATGDRDPGSRQLVLVSAWGATLSLVGLIVGLWVLVRSYQVEAGWFMPAAVSIGLSGIGLAAGAFFLIQHERFSRVLLGTATGALVAVIVVTAVAS